MKRTAILGGVVVIAGAHWGCNVGSAPSGMSGEEAADVIARMKPEDKIRAIANSPMPGPEKEKRYAEIERTTGVKASDVLGGQRNGLPGAGSATTK